MRSHALRDHYECLLYAGNSVVNSYKEEKVLNVFANPRKFYKLLAR